MNEVFDYDESYDWFESGPVTANVKLVSLNVMISLNIREIFQSFWITVFDWITLSKVILEYNIKRSCVRRE